MRLEGVVLEANGRGFTLAELLIVIVLVVILAAIALPNLLRSQIAANETAAIESLAKINKAEVEYQTTYPTVGFASTLATLGPGTPDGKCREKSPAHACLIEVALANAVSPEHTRSGYWFAVSPASRDAGGVVTGYVAGASAGVPDKTGSRDFCSQEDAVIRYSVPQGDSAPANTAPACAAMTILQ
jgi:prepilin-type N-terminal cleavage/methylation domain-containing protein